MTNFSHKVKKAFLFLGSPFFRIQFERLLHKLQQFTRSFNDVMGTRI
jgi:hypothetical protein